MKSYTYKISDSYIVFISSDANFSSAFMDYCDKHYGPHNQRGFAKSFAVQSFDEALSLFNIQHQRYIVIVDNNVKDGNVDLFYIQVQGKMEEQLKQFYDDPKELQLHKRIFESQTFFVLLNDNDKSPLSHGFPASQIQFIKKPVGFEEIDKTINPYVFVPAQWLRNPITYLPSFELINKKLDETANDIHRTSFYVKVIGFSQTERTKETRDQQIEIMRFIAEIIERAVEEQGDSKSWVGQLGGFDFFVSIDKHHLKPVIQQIQSFFEDKIQAFYSPTKTEQLSLIFHSQYNL